MIKTIIKKWWLLALFHLPVVFGLFYFFGTLDTSLNDDTDLQLALSVDLPHEHPLNELPRVEYRVSLVEDELDLNRPFEQLPEFESDAHALRKQKFTLTYAAIELYSSTAPSRPSTALVNLYALKALEEMSNNNSEAALITILQLRSFAYQWQNHSSYRYYWETHGVGLYGSRITCALVDQLLSNTHQNEQILNKISDSLATNNCDLDTMRKNHILLVFQFSRSVMHSTRSFQEFYDKTGEFINISPYSYHPNRTINACGKIASNHLKQIHTPVSQMIVTINDHQT